MIFSQYSIGQIRIGRKTQTRRLRTRDMETYRAGRDYAIQPGRGQKSIPGLRIRIISVRVEDIRDISVEDALAEGFNRTSDFYCAWVKMHDRTALRDLEQYDSPPWRKYARTRPDKYYQAWVYTFEVIRS